MAKSVGVSFEEGHLIDKFLLSMKNCNEKYAATILNYQTQRRNETLTKNYNLSLLSMTEIESALLSIDENSDVNKHRANFVSTYNNNPKFNKKFPPNKNKYKNKKEVVCYNCGEKGHIRPNCPLLKKNQEKVNQSTDKIITLKSSSTNAKANMVLHKRGNAGRRTDTTYTEIPLANDLANWVMDSGCTCHMTPFKEDFIPGTECTENRVVEVADGFTVPAVLSGTIEIGVHNDVGEYIKLKLENVLHVPPLARRLFSLMSLIDQDHDVRLSRRNGVQIYFNNETSPVSIPMPNYHLFASSANVKSTNLKQKSRQQKKSIELDKLYRRLGSRSIKTLLSANQADVWQDQSIIVRNDVISTSDHHIATIRKKNRNKSTESDPSLKPGQVLCMDLVYNPSKVSITQDSYYKFYLLVVDKYSRYPFLVGINSASSEQIINALKYIKSQHLQSTVNNDLVPTTRFQSDYGKIFTSEEFGKFTIDCNCALTLASPKHLEMNSIVERTWQSLCLLKNSFIVHARVDESCTHYALLHATKVFSVVPVRTLRKNGNLTTPYELLTGTKPKLERFRVLFSPCVVKKYSARVNKITVDVVKSFAQRGVRGMYVGMDDVTTGHLIFIPSIRQVISSIDVVFDESFITALAHQYRVYREALFTRPVNDVPHSAPRTEHTGDITQSLLPLEYAQLEEENGENTDTSEQSRDQSLFYFDNDMKTTNIKDIQNNIDYDLEPINDELSDSDDEDSLIFEPRRSQRNRNMNFKFSGKEWINMTKEIEEEKIPWSSYGDPDLFLPEPKGLKALLKLEDRDRIAFNLWSRAVRAEIHNLVSHGTFSIEDPRADDHVIPTTCIFKVKLESDGTWDKAKARYCVRGDIQRRLSTEDTWSATASKRTLRMVVADAARCGVPIFQLDFIGAFMQAPMRARAFVEFPKELVKICPKYAQYYGRPLRLLKSMYGQTFAGKWWWLELEEFLIKCNFRQSECDQALFVRKEEDGSYTKILTYVDDSIYYNSKNNDQILQQFQKKLSDKFKLQFQGHAHWFLSIRILRDKSKNFTIDQSRYAKNIVKKYLGHSEPLGKVYRPLPAEFIATKENCSKTDVEVRQLSEEYRIEYPAVIGSLIYLLNTRPDLMFAVTKLAKFMRMPGRFHFQAVIHVLKYLRDNSSLGIKYYHNITSAPVHKILLETGMPVIHDLVGMHDSSWQDCPDTGRSTGSYVHFAQGGPVDFAAYVPSPVAMSSVEAEWNAGATAGMAMSHLRMLYNELIGTETDMIWNPPILMLCDSASAVTLANSERDVKSLRHCKRRLFCMRQLRRSLELRYEHIDNTYMIADIGTKNLDSTALQPLCKVLLTKVA